MGQTVLTVVQFLHTEMGEEFDTESQAGDMAMEFSDKAVRRGFIRKVYSIISVQLLLTVGTMALFKMNYTIRDSMNPINGGPLFWPVFIVCIVLVLGIIIAMACVKTLRRSFPINFILL